MKLHFRGAVWCALLAAGVASGQVIRTPTNNCANSAAPCSVGSLTVAGVPYVTTAALTLYVSSTGSDANTCTGTGTAACLTIPGALAKVPKDIRHNVTINVAAGNFAGAHITGFTVESNVAFVIRGTMANSTLAGGSVTGTFASATVGSSTTTAWGTATVTAAGWTVNDLRYHWLVTTGGTGSGQAKMIYSNTATVATVTGAWDPVPDATTTFAIQDPASVINSAVTMTLWNDSVATTAGFYINANNVSGQLGTTNVGSNLSIERFKFSGSFRQLFGFKNNFTARSNWLAATNTAVQADQDTVAFVLDSYFSAASTGFVTTGTGGGIVAQGNIFSGNTTSGAVSLSGANYFVNANYWFNASTAFISITQTSQATINSQGDVFDCNSTGSGAVTTAANISSAVALSLNNSSISNCPTGILLRGGGVALLRTVTGTGNTIAIEADQGATVKVASSVSVTGTTEISVDGTASTLAAMRAATPAVVSNLNYGTAVFQ